jgi:hypothetical protein
MRKPNRALSVEAVEDRSLPSTTFVFFEPGFSYRSHQPAHRGAYSSESPDWSARSFQSESFIRLRLSDNSYLFLRETPNGFQFIPVFADAGRDVGRYQPPQPQPTVPTPVQGPVADGQTSSSRGSAGDNDGGNTPAAQSRGPVAPTGARANVGDVAIAPTAQSNAGTVRAQADQAARDAAVRASVQNGPPAVVPPAPLLSGHGDSIAYAFTAVNPDAEAPADAVPPVDPTPMPGPAPTPAPDGGIESGVVQLAAAAVGPVAGLVPFDLTTLSTGAGQFLDRVSDLAPSWPDAMPGFTDSLWVATAAVLGGGAIYASRGRAVPRPGRDPLASALSEWERRNGRAAG